MTRKFLERIYNNKHHQPGDTDKEFYEWAIDFLLKRINKVWDKK
jgi:hypothetical protein